MVFPFHGFKDIALLICIVANEKQYSFVYNMSFFSGCFLYVLFITSFECFDYDVPWWSFLHVVVFFGLTFFELIKPLVSVGLLFSSNLKFYDFKYFSTTLFLEV